MTRSPSAPPCPRPCVRPWPRPCARRSASSFGSKRSARRACGWPGRSVQPPTSPNVLQRLTGGSTRAPAAPSSRKYMNFCEGQRVAGRGGAAARGDTCGWARWRPRRLRAAAPATDPAAIDAAQSQRQGVVQPTPALRRSVLHVASREGSHAGQVKRPALGTCPAQALVERGDGRQHLRPLRHPPRWRGPEVAPTRRRPTGAAEHAAGRQPAEVAAAKAV